METIHTIAWMKQVAHAARAQDRITGFVPTMGALHDGHFSLVRSAKQQCSPVVVSIFVNPRQFGPAEDLKKYPRPFEADREALEKLGVDYLFAPTPEEMYPSRFRTAVVVEGLGERLDGQSRPGHFRGVATVVLKLFEIVRPSLAYFGRKDAQQARILTQMAADLDLDTQLVVCPIVREPDGLALSSRNVFLKENDRRSATALYRALDNARSEIAAGQQDAARLLVSIRGIIDSEPGVKLDYAEIVDAETLEPVLHLRRTCLILLAAYAGNTRLIDNALVEQSGDHFTITV
jgi:pantoate--beta-alanine ligase